MDEKLHTCGCFPENLERIVANREALIELLSHCIKNGQVGRRQGVGVGRESNSPIAIDRGSEGEGYRAVGFFKHSGHDVGKGSSNDERIVQEGWRGTGGKEMTLSSWERWGSFGDTTLARRSDLSCSGVLLALIALCGNMCPGLFLGLRGVRNSETGGRTGMEE